MIASKKKRQKCLECANCDGFACLPLDVWLDGKIKEHCVGRMLKAANEWKENEDDPDITADQFKENMGAPIELIVQSGGKLEIYYGDGDMFGGHAIFVNVNTRNEIVRCELAG